MKTDQKIPEGWSVKKLGEMGKFVSGGTPDTENPEYWNGDIIWLTPSEITKLPTRFVSDSERKITKEGLKNSSAVLLPVGSLIVCTRATVGDCCINVKEVSTNQGFKNLIPENSNIDFLYYLVSSHKTDLIRKACGSTFLEISKHDIEKLKYSVPPLCEQEKIAEILGTWDTAIEKLSALIEQKKRLKKGLMQRLLTGKQRLPGFSDPWKVKKIGECTLSFSGGTPSVDKAEYYENGKIPFIRSGEIYQDFTELFITEKGLEESSAKMVKKGDLLLALYGANSGDSSVCKIDGAINQAILCIRTKEDNLNFLESLFVIYKNKIIHKYLQGGQGNLSAEIIKSLCFIFPPPCEQKKIADILSKADEEITLLTRKLSALKTQKTGLMQKLLTGQIRVKAA